MQIQISEPSVVLLDIVVSNVGKICCHCPHIHNFKVRLLWFNVNYTPSPMPS